MLVGEDIKKMVQEYYYNSELEAYASYHKAKADGQVATICYFAGQDVWRVTIWSKIEDWSTIEKDGRIQTV